MVDAAAGVPWLEEPLQRALREQRSHALLVHGPRGVGQFELSLALAQGWLCEAEGGPEVRKPCGRCASCHLVRSRSHPDLLVLIPEALRAALGWEADEGDDGGEKASKAKPSKEIKVEAVRSAVAFAQSTSARGRGKAVVLHPAERMNGISANTLLKTLEEPPGSARFVLSSGSPDELLPTVRSRCQAVALLAPSEAEAVAWLEAQGVAEPAALLAAAGGQPQEALAWHRAGIDAASWSRLPAALARGDASPIADWPPALLIETLQKLCHDLMRVAVQAPPRYFAASSLKASAAMMPGLQAWQRELQRAARNAEHPWNASLLAEALVSQGRVAMTPTGPANSASRRLDSVHSRP